MRILDRPPSTSADSAGHRWSRGPMVRLGLVALASGLGLVAPASAQGTFAYRKTITVLAGGLAGGPHLNFPLLVSLPNDASLLARVAAGGRDIMFRGEDDTTCGGPGTSPCLLSHEIEFWDGATGTLVAWVRVPSVNVNTVIYMYYGNAQIAAPTQAPAAVWDTGYVGVWHFGETGSGALNEYRDSGAFANHGRGGKGVPAAVPARVNGQVGFAQNFSNGDGTYNFVDAGSDGTLNISGNQIALQAWVRHNIVVNTAHGTPPATSAPYGLLTHKGWADGYSLWLMGDDAQCPGSDTKPCVVFNLPGRSYSLHTNMTAGPTAGAWHHIVGTYDGTTMTVYQDGVVVATLAKTGPIAPSSAEPDVYIGQGDLPENVAWSGQFEGDIDEVRVSRVTRSANWFLTEYRNQSAPASFYSLGAESTLGGPWALTPITVNYRSIGAAANYTTGTVSATSGSVVVNGAGTLWRTANRGRGDRMTIDAVNYTVLSVDSETQIRLTSPFTGVTGAGKAYTIARKFGDPQAWENCISFAAACPGVTSASLVADNRSEVGIVYYDGTTPTGSPVLTIDGSTTDATHTITVTADPGNRHPGRSGTPYSWAGFGNGGAAATIQVHDDYVTVEWLDIRQFVGGGATSHGILINNLSAANHVVVRYDVIHVQGDGILIADADAVVDIYDNVIYESNYGIHLPADLTPAARVNIFNNTIYSNNAATGPSGIKSTVRQTTQRVDLRNNIVHSNANGDLGVAPFFDRVYFFNGLFSDISAQTTDSAANATLNFTTVGTDCLYLGSANPFRGVAFNLATGGSGGADLQWSYWNGAWANLETTPFNEGTFQLQYNGYVYWSDDPAGWLTTSVSGSPALYYVRACLASGPYATKPVERQVVRADVSVAANSNLTSDQTAVPHGPNGGFATGQSSVPLASVAFVSTTVGSEDLHLQGTSVAVNAATALDRYFSADIDATNRLAPWDVGADEFGATALTADLAVTKTDGQTSAVPGDPVSYTIAVTNNGPDTVTSLFLNDVVPGAILSPTFTPSTGAYNSGTGEWTGLNMAATQSVVLTLAGTIDPFARGNLVNPVTVSPPAFFTDTNPLNDSATDTDTLTPSADLGLTKLDDVDPAGLGGVLTYTLAVTNGGPSGATGVTVTDVLPVNVTFESATPTQGSCAYDGPTRTVACALGSIASSSNASVSLKVRPQAVGSIENTGSVAGTEPDPTPGNNTASQTTTVQVSSIGVRFFTVTSTNQTNVLEWVNPPGVEYSSTEIVFRTDRYPAGSGDGTILYNAGVAGGQEKLPHATGLGSNGVTHYYGAFVHRTAAPLVSPGRFCTGRPFDTTGPVKWAFSTGATAVSPPTVGGAGVVAPSNDRVLYAMERGQGATSGEWPATWWPIELGDVVQSRSPVVPIAVGTANPVVFLGSQDGKVSVVDATQGGKVVFPWGPTSVAPMVQGAPAGIFTAFGGGFDYLLVGTRDAAGPNALVALNPFTGAEITRFDNGGAGPGAIGIINGMATVDYATQRVYFTSRVNAVGSATTLWCLQLVAPPTVFAGCGWLTPRTLGDIDSSPVVRGGRIYVGSTAGGGTVYSIDAATGNPALDRTFPHGNGQVKGFVFPDRTSDDIYFATENYVWGVSDPPGGPMTQRFAPYSLGPGITPSPVLVLSGTQRLYVGSTDGWLYQIDLDPFFGGVSGFVRLGNGLATVGAPSFDLGHDLVHVGSEAGIFYAVETPFTCPPPLTCATCVPAAQCTTTNPGQPCYSSHPALCGGGLEICTGVVGECQ